MLNKTFQVDGGALARCSSGKITRKLWGAIAEPNGKRL
jgi:hypothetical protein